MSLSCPVMRPFTGPATAAPAAVSARRVAGRMVRNRDGASARIAARSAQGDERFAGVMELRAWAIGQGNETVAARGEECKARVLAKVAKETRSISGTIRARSSRLSIFCKRGVHGRMLGQ